jgi:hypothetical protein
MCLWAEACNTAVDILNRCPHKVLKDKTLEEPFTSKKPEVPHFLVFGCPVYIHVPNWKRTKLESSSITFVGSMKLPRLTRSMF